MTTLVRLQTVMQHYNVFPLGGSIMLGTMNSQFPAEQKRTMNATLTACDLMKDGAIVKCKMHVRKVKHTTAQSSSCLLSTPCSFMEAQLLAANSILKQMLQNAGHKGGFQHMQGTQGVTYCSPPQIPNQWRHVNILNQQKGSRPAFLCKTCATVTVLTSACR